MPERTYSPHEVAAIIERAAEHQRPPQALGDTPGLTLAEIERAGHEAGLDPALLRAAAADLDAGAVLPEPARAGTSVAERWTDVPLRPDAWEDAVAALRLRFGPTSAWGWSAPSPDVTAVGAGREWSHTGLWGLQTTVSVSPRGDRTRIRVVQMEGDFHAETRAQGALAAGFVALIPALLAAALLAETLGMGDLVGVAAMLVVLALGVGLGGPIIARRTSRRRARQADEVRQIADDLARRLAAGASGTEPQPRAQAAEGHTGEARLDLSGLDRSGVDPEPFEEGAAQPGRRTRA